jgi:hypothetical protein
MGTTRRQTQAAAQKRVADIQPNQASGRPAPAPAANAFLGKPERVPQLVYVADFPNDGFLGEASKYYEFFGIPVEPVKSVHEILLDLAKRQGVFQRLAIVSHAHPRGMLLPMFSGATKGTNKEFFRELAKSDYDGLILMSPFEERTAHMFPWKTRIGPIMSAARKKNAAVLKPLGLDKDGTPPDGDLSEFFFHCMDAVLLKVPGSVTLKKKQLLSDQKKTLHTFIDEILNQLTMRLEPKPINGRKVTADEWKALRASLTAINFGDLNMTADFDLNLEPDSMNLFPSLTAFVKAVRGGLRTQIGAARARFDATSRIDIRGCRVGNDAEYVEAIGEFLGRPNARPTVTGPQRFQQYAALFFDTLNSRDNIRVWLSKTQRQHSPQRLREILTSWAEMIRVRPLHTDFWTGVLGGSAVRLLALTEKEIPKLFLAAPGLTQFTDPDMKKVVGALANFFNAPKADVPAAAAITKLSAAAPDIRTASAALLAAVPNTAAADRLQQLYETLKAVSKKEGQTIVPDTAPTPLRVADIRDYQKRLLDHFDAGPLAPLKKLMTAAATSLADADGLFYYMFMAGLPVFVFGRPEPAKNSIVVFTPHATAVQQSWYQCLWTGSLPDKGDYKTTAVSKPLAHTMPTLVEEDRASLASVCPLPRYGLCMRTRPLPQGEPDNECDSLSNP